MGIDTTFLVSLIVVVGFCMWPVIAARLFNARRSNENLDTVNRRCLACGYDLRATPDRCSECGELIPRFQRLLDPTKLRDDWPAAPIEPREPSPTETLVVVWHPPHGLAANLLVEQLRARGVKVIVQSKARAMRIGEYTPQGDDHAVAVWSDDLDRVQVILERFAR